MYSLMLAGSKASIALFRLAIQALALSALVGSARGRSVLQDTNTKVWSEQETHTSITFFIENFRNTQKWTAIIQIGVVRTEVEKIFIGGGKLYFTQKFTSLSVLPFCSYWRQLLVIGYVEYLKGYPAQFSEQWLGWLQRFEHIHLQSSLLASSVYS